MPLGAHDALLFGAAVLGGALNSVVGGGSFVAFPALVFAGVPPISANATSALALWPGAVASAFAYRHDFALPRSLIVAFGAASLVGGGLGALILLRTPNPTFVRLVPWLMLLATVLFTFGGSVTARLRRGAVVAHGAAALEGDAVSGLGGGALVGGAMVQLVIAIYGGYFGGGMGIMMLATWTLLGLSNLHAMNGLRTLLGALLNGVALVAFVVARVVAWRPAVVMVVGATLAGYLGATVARSIDPKWVRRFVTAVAWAMTIYFFARGAAGR